MRRVLFPAVLLLLGAVAPAVSDTAQRNARGAAAQMEGEFLVYQSRDGDTLRGIRERWLLPAADLRQLQIWNGVAGDLLLPSGTAVRIPERWVKTLPVAAHIAAFRGEVRIVRRGEGLPAAMDMQLHEEDELETGPNGFVTLVLPDGSRVSLPSASRVAIERLRSVPMLDMLDRRFVLVRGHAGMKVTPMVNPASRFLVTTPVAVAAVRGTEYRVSFTPAEMRAVTEVREGRVAVRLLDGSAELLLEAGFAAIAGVDGIRGPLQLPARPLVAVRTRIQTAPEVLFRLQPRPGIARYLVEIAADAEFADLVASGESATDTVIFRDIPDGHYYARAHVIDADGLRSLPTAFEFDRALQPAGGTASRLVSDNVVPAAYPGFPDVWFSGVGGGGLPVVSANDVAWLGDDGAADETGGADSAEGGGLSAAPSRLLAAGLSAAGGFGGFGAGSGGGFAPDGSALPGFAGGTGGSGQFATDPLQPDSTQGSGGRIPHAVPSGPVPEPRVWLLLLSGFGLVGWAARSRRRFA